MIDFLVVALTLGCIYTLLATSLNLQLGCGGLANLGLAGFFAVGAYVTAMSMAPRHPVGLSDQLSFRLGLPWVLAAMVGIAATAAIGLLIGLLMSRIRLAPLFVAILTLAFAQLITLIVTTERGLANGFNGVRNVQRPLSDVIGYFEYERYFLLFLAVVTAIIVLGSWYLTRTPYGRTLRALREDSELVESLGYDVKRVRLSIFVLGCAVAGLAGALWAPYTTVVEPSAFTISVTFLALCIVIVGGSGNALGPAVGSVLVVCLIQEGSRFLPDGFATTILPSLRGVLIGVLLVAFVRLRPEGIAAERPQRHSEEAAS